MTRVLAALLLTAGLATGGACGRSGDGAVVLVSGRDDHGLLQRPALGLQRAPADATVVAKAHDGEFALVLAREGTWARLRLLAGGEEGWLEDHYLRGEAVRIEGGPRRVRLIDAETRPSGVVVRVRHADDGSEEWVAAEYLREVGAR